MANIKLKNAQGIEQIYNGITSIKVPLADGSGNATYSEKPNLISKTITQNGTYRASEESGVTITWNGDTNGRDSIDLTPFGINKFVYKVSDDVFDNQDLIGAIVGFSIGITKDFIIMAETDDYIASNSADVVIVKKNNSFGYSDGVYFKVSDVGIDFISSLTLPNVSVDGYSEVVVDVKPQGTTGSVTLASGTATQLLEVSQSQNKVQLAKQGNYVIGHFEVESANIGVNKTVFTLPDGFKPRKTVSFLVGAISTGQGSDFYDGVTITINTNGTAVFSGTIRGYYIKSYKINFGFEAA